MSTAPLFRYLNRPVEREQMTDDQRAVMDATETELGFEMALGSNIPGEVGAMLAEMGTRGWHAKIQSPCTAGGLWWAGFTPLGTTGWNGSPDVHVGDVTLRGALWRAVLLALMAGTGYEEADARQDKML